MARFRQDKKRKGLLKTNGSITSALSDSRLQVAQRRLADTDGREDTLEAIRDIVTNLLGSEEIALFTVDKRRGVLRLLWSFGIDAARNRRLAAGTSPILRRVIDGETYVEGAHASRPEGDPIDEFNAFVPLFLGSRTVAVLGIRSLLPQKPGWDESDVKLLRFLSAEAGKTLFGREADTMPENVEHL
jgi:hypothetical protein